MATVLMRAWDPVLQQHVRWDSTVFDHTGADYSGTTPFGSLQRVHSLGESAVVQIGSNGVNPPITIDGTGRPSAGYNVIVSAGDAHEFAEIRQGRDTDAVHLSTSYT